MGLIKATIKRTFGGTVLLAVAVGLACAAPVGAKSLRVERVTPISPPDPFNVFANVFPPCLPPTREGGVEREPVLAVNPAAPKQIVAGWMQDRHAPSSPAAIDVAFARTGDGGRRWDGGRGSFPGTFPGTTLCTGGDAVINADPRVSFGPDGTAYFASLPGKPGPRGLQTKVLVHHSTDGGQTWHPNTVEGGNDGSLNDRDVLAADPAVAGRVYVAWIRAVPADPGEPPTRSYFSSSTDFGETWSEPVVLEDDDYPIDLRVLTDGTLIYVSTLQPEGRAIKVVRSRDGGGNWERVGTDALPRSGTTFAPHDPDTERAVDTISGAEDPTVASGPDGTLYMAWPDNDSCDTGNCSSDSGRIVLTRSTDGGETWSAPKAIGRGSDAQAFLPTLAVAADGTVGLMYYDFRNNQGEDANGDGLDDQLTTDVWFASSRDQGTSWEEVHLAGSFDARGPDQPKLLGEYAGLAALPDGFAAVFTQTRPKAGEGVSDIFFGRLKVGG